MMLLHPNQVAAYRRHGYLVIDSLFDRGEVLAMREAFSRDTAVAGPHRITERATGRVRAVYASHDRQPEFAALVHQHRLIGPVQQLLDCELYVYQVKINAKAGDGGDSWSWHQDFPAWQLADNLPRPDLVNVAVFLDDMTEFNGPVVFVPGSHAGGTLPNRGDSVATEHLDPDDIAIDRASLSAMVAQTGMHAPKGPAGSVVFFSPEIVHGSGPNISPDDRALFIVTYSAFDNRPAWPGEPRPEYLVGRGREPLAGSDTPIAGADRRGSARLIRA